MRKLGLVLLLALVASCAALGPRRDLREHEPVSTRKPDPVVAFVAELIYFLGSWLGPKT